MLEIFNVFFVVVIGVGFVGLMVVEVLLCNGVCVEVFDVMFLVGCKFLLVGFGGMNIMYFELIDVFFGCYCMWCDVLVLFIGCFSLDVLCVWIYGFGIDMFVGSLGWVFLIEMKVVFLLCVWLYWLCEVGV